MIAIDARFWGEAGPGRYAKAMVQHLEKIDDTNNYVILLRKNGYDNYFPAKKNFVKILADYPWYSFSEQVGLLFKLLKLRPDLYYVPHFNFPILYPFKTVTAIPDIIMHSYSTSRSSTLTTPVYLIKKLAYYFTLFNTVMRSERIIVPTNDVKSDFLEHYKFAKEDKFVIAPEGVDPDLKKDISPEFEANVLKDIDTGENYILYVGSMYRHKNTLKLVDAFHTLVNSYKYDGKLVMVGKDDYFAKQVENYVKIKELEDRVILPGLRKYVSDDEVIALRKNAQAYVCPSLKEGFSLTPLEAQVWGVPCVISNIGCHREVYGDSVAYFNPNDSSEMAVKIWKVLNDEGYRTSLVEKGYLNTQKYDWEKTAQITLNVFNHILRN